MRRAGILTPFHESYIANTVAQVKELLWSQFKNGCFHPKDEPYEYKNEEILYQERVVEETTAYKELLDHLLKGGKRKFVFPEPSPKKSLSDIPAFSFQSSNTPFIVLDDGEIARLPSIEDETYTKLKALVAKGAYRRVLSFVEYPEAWVFVYKYSQIDFKVVGSKKFEVLKIHNRESTKSKFGLGGSFLKLRISKNGFVRYFNGSVSHYLSLKNWHNTQTILPNEALRLLATIHPNNEFLRSRTEEFPLQKYNIPNGVLRRSSSWKSLYKNVIGVYRENIPFDIALSIAEKVPRDKREAFFARFEKDPAIIEKLKKRLTDKYFFEEAYNALLGLDHWNSLVIDAFRMAKDLGEEFNYFIQSAKKFEEYHNDLSKRHQLLGMGPLKPHDKYRILESNDQFQVEFIDSSERLLKESQELHHCVSSYARRINVGQCGIYSIWDGKERWTCEVTKETSFDLMVHDTVLRTESGKYSIVQCRGLSNKQAPTEVMVFLKKQIDKANKNIPLTTLEKRLTELRNAA